MKIPYCVKLRLSGDFNFRWFFEMSDELNKVSPTTFFQKRVRQGRLIELRLSGNIGLPGNILLSGNIAINNLPDGLSTSCLTNKITFENLIISNT